MTQDAMLTVIQTDNIFRDADAEAAERAKILSQMSEMERKDTKKGKE